MKLKGNNISLLSVGLFASWMITAILVCCVIELFSRVKKLSAKISSKEGESDVSK